MKPTTSDPAYLLRIIYMRYLYVEFVCKYLCIYRIYIIRSRYLKNVTAHVYSAMLEADPHATWVIQGWLFQ